MTRRGRERRAEGLAAAARCRREQLLALAEPLAATGSTEVVSPPAAQSVMVEVATAVGECCLAEVVVTTASVLVSGSVGWACLLGWDEHGALAAALCDAVAAPDVDALAEEALAVEAADRRMTEAAVAR
ncbi:MAG: phosphonate C-P lyase system protein PhnG, partial [Acidimicrobiaceae bacterium]|nr:phosphonate C-P lyase system protein PhnG [Acidimicrobiaceae bacterium]